MSEAKLKEANEWMKDTLPSRKVNKLVACTILIMQRLHQNDTSAQMLQIATKEDATPVRHICLPARLSDQVRPIKLRSKYSTEGLLDPIRLPERVLRSMEALMGQYGAAGQLMQNPVPAEGGMFKTVSLGFRPRPVKYRRIVRYWDKAGSSGKGCFTVGLLMIEDMDGSFGILDVVRGQWESATREKMIRQTAELDGRLVPIGIEQEGGSGGKESAENTIRQTLVGFRVTPDRPVGDKVLRADPFSVQVNEGNVWILQDAHWADEYVKEMQFFPLSTYKDQIDASSGAFNYLMKNRGKVGAF
jgi:predicted phage terminase large subunit-like protein